VGAFGFWYFKVPKAFRPQLFDCYPLTGQDSIYKSFSKNSLTSLSICDILLKILYLIHKSHHFTYVHSQQVFLLLVQPSSPGVNLQFTVNIRANRRLTPAVLFFLVLFPTTNRVQAKTPMTLFSNWYYGFYYWPNRSSG
ncbi:hypothetical protein, partial [Microcoleus sp.]|uniref:hypothetical protein n=1 Tax=Microcoleus sp. TaxID=44472 RepID=UPI00403E9F3E